MEATALDTIDARVRELWPPRRSSVDTLEFLTRSSRRDPVEIERDDFYNNRKQLMRDLDQRHIQPIAVMPEKIWERLRSSVDLHVLKLDADAATVSLYPYELARKAEPTFLPYAGLAAILALLGTIGMGAGSGVLSYHWMPKMAFGVHVTASIGVALFGAFVGMMISSWISMRLIPLQRAIRTTGWLGRRRARRLAEAALRDYTPLTAAVAMQPKYCGQRFGVKLILPPAPTEVEAILSRASGMDNLRVAVLEGAARFEPSIATVLASGILPGTRTFSDVYATEFDRDPIVFCKFGNAIALIAQWGECPIEEETVRRAVRLDTLKDPEPTE